MAGCHSPRAAVSGPWASRRRLHGGQCVAAEEKAPFGLRMGGKTQNQMLARLREFHRNVSQPLRVPLRDLRRGGQLR